MLEQIVFLVKQKAIKLPLKSLPHIDMPRGRQKESPLAAWASSLAPKADDA